MPGRIVGATVDARGDRGYVLTFQTREQHIRREKATSNICSNEALCALAAAVYLSWMGPAGLRAVAETCLQRSHYAARRLAEVGYPLAFPEAPFFKELAVRCSIPPVEANRRLLERGIVGGFPLGRLDSALEDCLLLCVTEMNPREEIDRLVEALAEIAEASPAREEARA
jgi:glycine dehydrogenase subunit 1